MKPGKELIFKPETTDLKEFESLSAAAREAGFTHISISGLNERTDYRGEDCDSPWCEWSIMFPCIFKHAMPAELGDAFPADFVKRQMDFMKQKHVIVGKLGMKAAYHGLEPHWLSERVYAVHPEWRGSRCDNSLRTTGMYFAPNVYHPEVLDLYTRAVSEIVKQCPAIDTFIFHTNDCGAGFPCAEKLYVNPNGPTGYTGRDLGICVRDFLRAIRKGSVDAGGDAHVFTAPFMMEPEELHLLDRSLEPGIGIVGMATGSLAAECSLSHCGSWGGAFGEIIDGFPTPAALVNGVTNVKTSRARRFQAAGSSPAFFKAFKAAMAQPAATTLRRRIRAQAAAAAALYAEDAVDPVLDAWDILARVSIREQTGGVFYLGGPVMLRWLVRPLVPYQEMLTPEERSYWEPYIYQSEASQPESYLDYLNLTGKPVAARWDSATPTCIAVDSIDAELRAAAGLLEKAAEATADEAARDALRLDALRLRAKACVALTIRHTLQMGTLIYERDRMQPEVGTLPSVDPEIPDLSHGSMGSKGMFFMYRAMRWELDNVYELISLIAQAPAPLITCVDDKKLEGRLVLGPDVLEGLKKKAAIMLKYWRSAEKGYYRPTKGG